MTMTHVLPETFAEMARNIAETFAEMARNIAETFVKWSSKHDLSDVVG